jgi:hypothetical protein
LLDKTGSVATENTTSAFSHLAFCALVALGLARQDGIASTSLAEKSARASHRSKAKTLSQERGD